MNDFKDYGLVFLRLGIGFAFLWAGIHKLFIAGPAAGWMAEFFASWPFLQWVMPTPLGVLELCIGILLIVGLFTRIVGIIATILLLGFIVTVSAGVTGGFSSYMWQPVAILGGAICLAFTGSTPISLDGLFWR
ncbi:DoxX family protein [Candidatus Woesearchaeota archaeon]|nr:DoxX family protein [Candidatus Woesearchaeota archaeon]